MSVTLTPYQQLAVDFWNKSEEKRILFGLPPGSGKTIIALKIIKEEIQKNPNSFILLVTPASLKFNFPQTIDTQKWGIKYFVLETQSDLKKKELKTANLIICSYHFVAKYYKDFYHIGRAIDLLVADEIHYGKNDLTHFSLSFFLLSRLARKVALFTASYVALDLEELKQILMYLVTNFQDKEIIEEVNTPEDLEKNLNVFKKYTFVLSREFVNKHLKLPEVDIKEIIVELEEKETKLLVLAESKIAEEITRKLKKKTATPFSEINFKKFPKSVVAMQLMLLFPSYISEYADNPNLTQEKIKAWLGREYSSKVAFFLNVLKKLKTEDPKSKHIIFVPFIQYGALDLSNIMSKSGFKNILLTGQLSLQGKVEAVNKFTDPKSGYDYMILTLAGKEGLNLQIAKYCHFLGYSWNPEDINQIAGRIVRIGSPHDVVHVLFYHAIKNKKLVDTEYKNVTTIETIDSKMLKAIKERMNLKGKVEKILKRA